MPASSFERYIGFYGQEPALNATTKEILRKAGSLPRVFEILIGQVSEVFSNAPSILRSLVQNLELMIQTMLEKTAATALADNFGSAQSLMAVPVAIKLADMELEWNTILKNQIVKTEVVVRALTEGVQTIVGAMLMELAGVEDQIVQYLQLKRENQVVIFQNGVAELHAIFDHQVDNKLALLMAKKDLLVINIEMLLKFIQQHLSLDLSRLDTSTPDRITQISSAIATV